MMRLPMIYVEEDDMMYGIAHGISTVGALPDGEYLLAEKKTSLKSFHSSLFVRLKTYHILLFLIQMTAVKKNYGEIPLMVLNPIRQALMNSLFVNC